MNEVVATKRVSPVKFFQQVKQEASRVTWPSRKETLTSALLVFVMASIAAVFFLFIDWVISSAVQAILGL
ncbi:MAG: preprotein translocase subunit SecE [Proteobacteria bacterium]|nr:preprotein translocase subunit SecE [Pseudomonadota bacterium]